MYHFKHGVFKHFIQRIENQSMVISDALGTFREVKCLPKEFKEMKIWKLTDNPDLIMRLSKALRDGMKPESRFKLPYKKDEREKQLIDNISETHSIDKQKAKAKIVSGHNKDENTGQEFNYTIEVVIAPRTDVGLGSAGEAEIIGNINSTPSIDGGERYFDGMYVWRNRQGQLITSRTIREILQECGFNTNHYVKISKKKIPCIVYLNLNTPCPDWLGSAGKTHIDLRPYADDIAKTVSALAYRMPSYHGYGITSNYKAFGHEEDIAKRYLEAYLMKRYNAVAADPSIKTKDRLTQSAVFYRIRLVMTNSGFTPPKDWGTTRKYIQGSVNKVCAELFGHDVKREDLGIIAASRATMLYDSQTYAVTIDNVEELAGKGVAIVVIEKESIADVLAEYAREDGVALVHTQGRLTEYGKDLIEASSSPVGTLTDYDAYGIQISEGTRNKTPRIGIDMETITWLQQNGYPDLKREDVEEEYTPNIWTDDEYLKHHRIELDSIVAKVGAEGLWKYVKYKLQLQAVGGFDYNNVITQPESEKLYPEVVIKFLSKLNKCIERITGGERQKIETELVVKELIPTRDTERKLRLRLENKVTKDEVMQTAIIPRIKQLLDELSDWLK